MGRACSTHGEKRNAYRILVVNPKANKPVGRPRRRCEDNVRMDPREIGWGGVDWIDLLLKRDQWRTLVNTVMNLRVLQKVGKLLSRCASGGFSRTQLHGVS
jgi:hypothetical protein